jgi:hypothetical protein
MQEFIVRDLDQHGLRRAQCVVRSVAQWRVQKCIRDEFIMILMMILIELTRNVLVNQTEERGIETTAPAKMQAT